MQAMGYAATQRRSGTTVFGAAGARLAESLRLHQTNRCDRPALFAACPWPHELPDRDDTPMRVPTEIVVLEDDLDVNRGSNGIIHFRPPADSGQKGTL